MKNSETISAKHFDQKKLSYANRSVHSLLYIKATLEREGELVPTDLLAALSAKGVYH